MRLGSSRCPGHARTWHRHIGMSYRPAAAPLGPRRVPLRFLLWALLVGLASTGCAQRGYDDYVPSPQLARRALEDALQTWQRGEHVHTLDRGDSVPVQPVDSAWTAGHKLRSFEVVGETHGDSPRCFAVRLWLDNQNDEQLVRYYVLGIKPLWVFRQDDYDMMAHWECPPELASREQPRGM